MQFSEIDEDEIVASAEHGTSGICTTALAGSERIWQVTRCNHHLLQHFKYLNL